MSAQSIQSTLSMLVHMCRHISLVVSVSDDSVHDKCEVIVVFLILVFSKAQKFRISQSEGFTVFLQTVNIFSKCVFCLDKGSQYWHNEVNSFQVLIWNRSKEILY